MVRRKKKQKSERKAEIQNHSVCVKTSQNKLHELWCWPVSLREPAYLHLLAVQSLYFHTNCTLGSVTGAAMLDLLALQLHGCRPVTDNADRFLETDALQGSLSWYGVTDILGRPPRLLRQRTKDRRFRDVAEREELSRDSLKTMFNQSRNLWKLTLHLIQTHITHTQVCLHCSSGVNPLQQQEFWLTPTTRGHRFTDRAETEQSSKVLKTTLWINKYAEYLANSKNTIIFPA